MSTTTRDERLNLRTSAAQMDLLRNAAKAADKTITQFVLDSASAAAEQTLADRRWFVLDDQQWAEFEAALDRPAVAKPRLAALMTAPDPFED